MLVTSHGSLIPSNFNFLIRTCFTAQQLVGSEGNVKIFAPKEASIFYNPSMVSNRDLTIGALQNYYEMVDDLTHDKYLIKKSNNKNTKEISKI